MKVTSHFSIVVIETMFSLSMGNTLEETFDITNNYVSDVAVSELLCA